MVGGIYNNYNAYSGIQNYLAQKSYSVSNYDYKAAQKETAAMIAQYKKNSGSVQTLKTDAANFLDSYTASMKNLSSAASAVSGQNFDKLLYGTAGAGSVPTDEAIDKTTAAVEKLVTQFNDTLSLLNKNADRGGGVSTQIERMVQSPTSERSMELIGITTQKDGTLKVDTEKLKTALREKTSTVRDVVAGNFGMAQGMSRDSVQGLNQSAASLISNDLAEMKSQQDSFKLEMLGSYTSQGIYSNMNLNSVGVLMNIAV